MDPRRRTRGARWRHAGVGPGCIRSEPRRRATLSDFHDRGAGRHRQRVRCARRRTGARAGDGNVDLVRTVRRCRLQVQAGACVSRVDPAVAVSSTGSVRSGASAVSVAIFNAPFWTFVGVIAGIYTILSLGLYLQYAMAGLPNFGHVAFMALAAYTMAFLVIRFGAPMPVAILAGLTAAVLFSLLLGLPSLRLRADYLAIVTVAGGEVVRYLALNLQDITGGAIGSIGMLGPSRLAQYNTGWDAMLAGLSRVLRPLFGALASRDFAMLLIVWAIALVLLGLCWVMVRSPWGRVLRSIREDENAAAAVGKN
ncbi:MAG: branched-chain amino acid ABC transporter permease, partial [Chloroflexi bacterium]